MDVESATPASVDMGDEDCFAGTGRDCLTVVEIVSIGAFSSIGSVILIGAIFMGIYLNGRDTRRGRRFLSWCAKICCCEPAVDDDTLVQIITHPQEGTPEDNRTGISSEENNVSAAAASNNDSHESPPKVFRPDTPSEPATSPNTVGNIAPAEACEVKNEPVSPVQCQIEPKVEPVTPQGLVEPKVEPLTPQSLPDSPQSYAEAAKANLSPINTTNSSRGDADVTDTSTPNKSAAGKGKRSLLSALFGGGGGGSSARKLSNAADSSKLSNNDSSNPMPPTSPENNEKSHVEEKSFPEEEILEKSEIEDNEKGDKKNQLEESVAEQQQQSWTGGSSSSSAEADFSPDESCDTSALTGGAGGDTSAVSGFDTSGAAAGATPSSRKNNSSFFGRLRSRMASPPPTNNDDSNLD